jgi:hypothetical protein
MTELEVLRAARETLADPARWERGGYAFDGERRWCGVHDERACRFCLVGAMMRAAGPGGWEVVERAALLLMNRASKDGMPYRLGTAMAIQFNDQQLTKHADVLSALDAAIDRAGEAVSCPS